MSLDEHEAETQVLTLADHANEIALLDRVLEHFLRLDVLSGQKFESQAQRLILTLGVRSFNSLRCARDALLRGYYVQAMTLARAALEDWVTCLYVRKYPDEAQRWYETDRPPSLGGMRRKLNHQELDATIKEAYDVLSKFSHPSFRSVAASVDQTPGNTFLRLGGKYDAENFTGTIYAVIVEAMRMLRVPSIYVKRVSPEWVDTMRRIEQEVIQWRNATRDRLRPPHHHCSSN